MFSLLDDERVTVEIPGCGDLGMQGATEGAKSRGPGM